MQTKQKIYEVAKILYITEGYHNVSNKYLAQQAEVNQGLITYYFKSKANIATTILREIYLIQSSYIKNKIDLQKDPLLYNISADNLISRTGGMTKEMTRFYSDMIAERILLENVYHGGQKNDLQVLLRKIVPESRDNPNKHFRKFVALTFPAAAEFQLEIWKGLDMSYEEYFETMVGLFGYGLQLNLTREEIQTLAQRSNDMVLEIIEANPHLKKPEDYLFHKNVFQPTLAESLLDLR